MFTRNSKKQQSKDLISASKLSNFVKNDMIGDYLDLLNEKLDKLLSQQAIIISKLN